MADPDTDGGLIMAGRRSDSRERWIRIIGILLIFMMLATVVATLVAGIGG